MSDKIVLPCPVCGGRSLVTHCGDNHPTCTWHKCRANDCDAVLDLRRGRGHCLTADGKKRRLVNLGESA